MSRTTFRGPGEDGEEEESDGTEDAPAAVGAYEGTRGPTLAQSDQPVSYQTEPSFLAIMQKMTQIMANLQAAASSEVSRPPVFKTSSMKAPECFDGTQPSKSEVLFSLFTLFFTITWQISLKTERRFFMPLDFWLAGLQNGLSLIFPITRANLASIIGN
ncbi:hypothetical protein O181_072006 [Austropuccinia psidii MF-1]|uniref:Uncharacterized protein n=1 Tax=Austropuccinia psidii MF-1 TaxID=1389203 RepID=A0A9Q3F1T6_9BASI|nr:hypothetical protein [Austropuccinia psidii MF-1]